MYFVEKTKGINFIRQFDYMLFIAVLLLSAIGILALGSATLSSQSNSVLIKQVISVAIGIIAALVISTFDYKDFKTLGIVIYIVSIILLVVVIFKGSGRDEWGANSWLNLPLIGSYQPSEIAKIAVIVVISIFFERIKEGQLDRKNILKLFVYTAIPVALVLKQPDMGTAMVFMFVFTIMVFICGIPYRYIFIALGTFVASLPVLWLFVLQEHQKWRFKVFLDPDLDKAGKGFQVIRSKLAIGSGQIYGQGLFQGIQTQNNGVPVNQTDFIFTVIGEELGFIGSVAVLVIIFFILMRCLYIAKNSRDAYGSFVVVGLTGMMGFHFIENIGMCIGVLPVTGIPLPFMSQGGSAMVTNYIAIGIILSISMRRKRTIFNNTQ